MNVEKLTMDGHGTIKATNMEVHGGLKKKHGYTRVSQQIHGSQGERKTKMEEEMP
jgi:hypothetical protein